MSARSVRRSFASPFVVTLAAAVPMAACYVAPAPARSGGSTGGDHRTGGERASGDHEGEPAHVNPPRPVQPPMQNMPDGSTTNAGAEQAPAAPTTVVSNPPPPAKPPVVVAKADRRWTITRAAGKCSAFNDVSCPKPPAGQPAPICNPPPPTAYACLPAMADGEKVTVVQRAGQSDCWIEHAPIQCPPNTMCNPPPPQKAACPK